MKYNEFVDSFDKDRSKRVVTFAGKTWFSKHRKGQGKNREFLASLLANKKLNIPKLRPVTKPELKKITGEHEIDLHPEDSAKNNWLVRLAQEYKSSQLPIKNLDEAVAAEMVFSVLIRRRDMHSSNRVYLSDGIPMFFDFSETSFLGEEELVGDGFFILNRNDGGYIPNLRLLTVPKKFTPRTLLVRELEKSNPPFAFHVIHSKNNFEKYLQKYVASFAKLKKNFISKQIKKSKIAQPEEITAFLLQNQKRLEKDVKRLKKIIFKKTDIRLDA